MSNHLQSMNSNSTSQNNSEKHIDEQISLSQSSQGVSAHNQQAITNNISKNKEQNHINIRMQNQEQDEENNNILNNNIEKINILKSESQVFDYQQEQVKKNKQLSDNKISNTQNTLLNSIELHIKCEDEQNSLNVKQQNSDQLHNNTNEIKLTNRSQKSSIRSNRSSRRSTQQKQERRFKESSQKSRSISNNSSSSNSSSMNSFSSSSSDSGSVQNSSMSIDSHISINKFLDQKERRNQSNKSSIYKENQKSKQKDQQRDSDLSINGGINSKNERLSIFSSQNLIRKSTLMPQKTLFQQSPKNSISGQQKQMLNSRFSRDMSCGEISPLTKKTNFLQQHEKHIQELNKRYQTDEGIRNSFQKGSEFLSMLSIRKQPQRQSYINSARDFIKQVSLRKSKSFDEQTLEQLQQKQVENSINVYQIENPTLSNEQVQKFFIETMKKIIKAPKEKNYIKKVLERVGLFEKQRDIIFKNQNTNDTLFNNLNIEEYDKHQVIFHIGEFGYKYYIVVQGGVHLLLPNMGEKQQQQEIVKDSAYVNYMNAIQSGYNVKNVAKVSIDEQNEEEETKKVCDLKKCNFFLCSIIRNQSNNKIRRWVQEMGSDQKKITLLFGGLDAEKRHLINASFLEGQEFVNIFYPGMNLYKTFRPGETFGEIALLTKQRRTATMICSEKTYCLTLSKQGFDQIIGAYQKSQIQIQINFLQQFSFMEKIPKSKILSILHDMKKVEYQKGQVIYKEGDNSDFFYFVIEGDFEISKEEIIEQNKNLNNNQGKNLNNTTDSKIAELNWTEQIKKKQKETKRIPIIVQSSNTFFGQNEIIKNQSKRQTRAVCLSLNGVLFLISKNVYLFQFLLIKYSLIQDLISHCELIILFIIIQKMALLHFLKQCTLYQKILLHHLNNWNGFEELKTADRVINNWSYQRLSQIVEFQKIPTNKFEDLIKGTKMKKKKSHNKGHERQSISQNSQLAQRQSEDFVSKEELSLLSPKRNLQGLSRQSVMSQQGILATFNKQITQSKKKNSILETNTSRDSQIFDHQNSFSNNNDLLGVFKNDLKETRKSMMKSQFQFLLPSQSLPQHNMLKSFDNKDTQNHQALQKSNTIVSQQPECLSPTNFSKFKKYHDKRITSQLLELLEDQKKVDRRKSLLLHNLIEDSAQMSQSKISDKEKSRASMDEIQKSQTMIEQQTNVPKKRNPRASLFFPSQGIPGIQQISSNQKTESQIQISGERKSSTKNSNRDKMQKSFTQFNINSQTQIENSTSNNNQTNKKKSLLIQDFYENSDEIAKSPRNKQNSVQDSTKLSKSQINFNISNKQENVKNNYLTLTISKRNQMKQPEKQQQKPVNQQENKPEEKQVQQGFYSDYYHKQLPSLSQTQSRKASRETKLSLSSNSSSAMSNNSFIQSDQIIENDQDDFFVEDRQDDQLIAQGNLKEISKIRQAQLLERIKHNLYYNQPAQKSINSEDRKLDELDSKVTQLKELMDASPRITFQNINNVLNFKKRFLKILSSQPAILQKKLFDFRSHSEKYLFRKLKSNQKLAINQLFSQMSPQLQPQQSQKSTVSNEDQVETQEESNPQENDKFTNKLMQEIAKKFSSRGSNFFEPIKNMKKMSRLDPFVENDQSNTLRNDLSLFKNISKTSQSHEKQLSQPNSPLLQHSIDSIRKYMKSNESANLEKFKLDNNSISITSQSQKNSGSQNKKGSFFLSPRYNQVDYKKIKNNSLPLVTKFNDSSLLNNSGTNNSQANNTTMNIRIANNQSCINQQSKKSEISYDFTLQPDSGYIQKLNILSSRNQNRKNIIKKNFINFNSTSQQKDLTDQGTNTETNTKQIETKPKSYLYKLNPTNQKSQETFIDNNLIDLLPSQNTATTRQNDLLNKNVQQKVSNINFSTNPETGEQEQSQYIQVLLNKRKPIQQRIKEQQIKQKGIQYKSTSNNFYKSFQSNSKSFKEELQSPKLFEQTSKGSTLFNPGSFSGLSDVGPSNEKVYQFQSISPKKVFKKNS